MKLLKRQSRIKFRSISIGFDSMITFTKNKTKDLESFTSMTSNSYFIKDALETFKEKVAMRYQIYNSLFLTLPFKEVGRVGAELPIFQRFSEDGVKKGLSPKAIVEDFFASRQDSANGEKSDGELFELIFLLLQYVERQVVLFDALEDASFDEINDLDGAGTIGHLVRSVKGKHKSEELEKLLDDYRVRLVLTAHPTQFYPGSVLGIISNLSEAIEENDLAEINDLLLQLSKTKFSKKEKPTPYEEARALNWYLINVFYKVIPDLKFKLAPALENPFELMKKNPLFEVGFWPGGDRDGNPFVTHQTTLDVARLLKRSILNCYHDDVRVLKSRLTFEGVLEKLEHIQFRVFNSFEACLKDEFHPEGYNTPEEFLEDLLSIRKDLIDRHQSLFLDYMDRLIYKVISFGFHFASLDMRQDSRIHTEALLEFCKNDKAIAETLPEDITASINHWAELSDDQKYAVLYEILKLDSKPSVEKIVEKDAISSEVLRSAQAISKVQCFNGERGLHRYIISNTQRSADVLSVLVFSRWMGLAGDKNEKPVDLDIVPLFETIEDLKNARGIMTQLYNCPTYIEHLKNRKMTQSIMLGFSDGTKDGGPIAANWSIYQAKVTLSELSAKYGVTVHFFDGRGGPPARGGGNTHQYYRAQRNDIQQQQIQLTIQGQTISTKFGSLDSARYNLEELFTASLETRLFPGHLTQEETQTKNFRERTLMDELSEISLDAYRQFKNNDLFVPYLEEITPLKYISYLNIASRPTRRKSAGPMKFEDLRAIPFVSSWSQMRQNIPGYYGVGIALEKFIEADRKEDIVWMYENSLFFKTLMENAMMSLAKSNMKLTEYLSGHEKFGKFWKLIDSEVERCRKHLKEICGQEKLMDNYPAIRASIDLREQLVLPLLVIQQYALIRLREDQDKLNKDQKDALVKIILKALAANINASRNSA